MPRPRNAFPSRRLFINLPGDVGARLDTLLYSAAEQRIPERAHQRFIVERIKEFFSSNSLDLATYLSDLTPGVHLIRGNKHTIELLKEELQRG